MPQFFKYLSSPLSYLKQIKNLIFTPIDQLSSYICAFRFTLFSSSPLSTTLHPTHTHKHTGTYQMWSMRVLARSCRSSPSCLCRNRGNTSASRRCISITRRTLRNRSLPNHLGRTYQSSFFFFNKLTFYFYFKEVDIYYFSFLNKF
jgi:hypothetical protein